LSWNVKFRKITLILVYLTTNNPPAMLAVYQWRIAGILMWR